MFEREPSEGEVQNQEGHRYEVTADLAYLKRSIRTEGELAIAQSGAKKGEAYLTIMPRYTRVFRYDIAAIFAYLNTQTVC